MNTNLFTQLVESMTQMNEIARGKRSPSREFHVAAFSVKAPRLSPRGRRRLSTRSASGPADRRRRIP